MLPAVHVCFKRDDITFKLNENKFVKKVDPQIPFFTEKHFDKFYLSSLLYFDLCF